MTQLHLPPGLNYHCIQCGKSCTMFHEVPVEEESEARLLAAHVEELLPSERQALGPYLIRSLTHPDRRILRKHEGSCVFLGDDLLCSIHAAHGAATKPRTCQDFPFRYVEGEDGVYVGLSFACTAVQQNVGPSLEDQRGELAESWKSAVSHQRLEGPVKLVPRHAISWEAYRALESDLSALLTFESPTIGVGEQLLAQALYIDLYTDFLRAVRGDQPGAATAAPPGGMFPANTAEQDIRVLAVLRQKYLGNPAELFRLARRVRRSPTLQRAFIGLMTAFRQGLQHKTEKPGRLRLMASIFRHYLTHAFRLGRIKLDPIGAGRFDYGDFARFKMDEPALQPLLRRFFNHALFRKDLLLADSVWLGHRFLVMHYALLRWHVVGLASLRGCASVDENLLAEAIGILERYYVFHTPFGKLFEDVPMLGMLLDGIVRKPVFSGAMIANPA